MKKISNTSAAKRKLKLRNNIDAWMLMLPMVLVIYLFVWRPTVLGAVWSFFKMNAYTPAKFIGLANYVRVITNTQFLPILGNTVQYVIWSLIIGFLPPVIIAVMLNEVVHFRNGLRLTVYLPAVIPGVAGMLIWYFIYYPDPTGLLNMIITRLGLQPYTWLNDPKFTIPGLMIYATWKGFGGSMLLYFSALQGVSVEVYEAALIDGATPFQRIWHVTRPSLEGLLLLNLVNQIIGVFQILDLPLAITGGGRTAYQPLCRISYINTASTAEDAPPDRQWRSALSFLPYL